MKTSEIRAFAIRARQPVGYSPAAKSSFLSGARRLANEIVKRLGLQTAERTIRKNEGGIAVSGEIYVYTPHMFICIEQSGGGSGGFMYRGCDRLGDNGAGMRYPNQWIMWDRLAADPDYVLDRLVEFYKRQAEAKAA